MARNSTTTTEAPKAQGYRRVLSASTLASDRAGERERGGHRQNRQITDRRPHRSNRIRGPLIRRLPWNG